MTKAHLTLASRLRAKDGHEVIVETRVAKVPLGGHVGRQLVSGRVEGGKRNG